MHNNLAPSNFTEPEFNYRNKTRKPISSKSHVENLITETLIEEQKRESSLLRKKSESSIRDLDPVRSTRKKEEFPPEITNELNPGMNDTLHSIYPNSSNRFTKWKGNRPNDVSRPRLPQNKDASSDLPAAAINPLLFENTQSHFEIKKSNISHSYNEDEDKYKIIVSRKSFEECQQQKSIARDLSLFCKDLLAVDKPFTENISGSKSEGDQKIDLEGNQKDVYINKTQRKILIKKNSSKKLLKDNLQQSSYYHYPIFLNNSKTDHQRFFEQNLQNASLDIKDFNNNKKLTKMKDSQNESQTNSSFNGYYSHLTTLNKKHTKLAEKKPNKSLVVTFHPKTNKTNAQNNKNGNSVKYHKVLFSKSLPFKPNIKKTTNFEGKIENKMNSSNTNEKYNQSKVLAKNLKTNKYEYFIDSKLTHLSPASALKTNNKRLWDSEYEKSFRILYTSETTHPHLNYKTTSESKLSLQTPTIKSELLKNELKNNSYLASGTREKQNLETPSRNILFRSSSSNNETTNKSFKKYLAVKNDGNVQTTTITSEYDDYLIPPLPEHWPSKKEEKWNINIPETLHAKKNFTDYYIKHEKTFFSTVMTNTNDSYSTSSSISKISSSNSNTINSSDNGASKISSYSKVHFTKGRDLPHSVDVRSRPKTIKESEILETSKAKNRISFSMTKLSSQNLSEKAHSSLNKTYIVGSLIGKKQTGRFGNTAAATNEPVAPSYAKERINFITLPPVTQWHLWSSFTGRRRVDPFFEFSNANVTSDITQVYTAYWGAAGANTNGIAGVWILRLGAGIALLTLVSTVIAQTIRFCQPLLSQKAVLTTNLATSLGAAHVVFIFGIQVSKLFLKYKIIVH